MKEMLTLRGKLLLWRAKGEQRILAVVGAGHLRGIEAHLQAGNST